MFGLMTRNQNIYNPFRQMEALERAFFGNAFWFCRKLEGGRLGLLVA
jgi:hypothetical protein